MHRACLSSLNLDQFNDQFNPWVVDNILTLLTNWECLHLQQGIFPLSPHFLFILSPSKETLTLERNVLDFSKSLISLS